MTILASTEVKEKQRIVYRGYEALILCSIIGALLNKNHKGDTYYT